MGAASLPGGGVVVTLEGTVVQTVPLGESAVTIGRLPQNRVVLQHPSVSRYHAEVRLVGSTGEATVTDVGSSGGTFIGDEQLRPNQPYSIQGGMVFRIGPFLLTYVAPTGGPPRSEPLAEVPAPARRARSRQPEAVAEFAVEPIDETLFHVPSRPRHPVPLPDLNDKSRYLRYLPGLYQEDMSSGNGMYITSGAYRSNGHRPETPFFARMLLVFQALWEPLEWRQNHIQMFIDPRTCPATFLPWLASWLGLALDKHWPEERRRLLLSEAMELYRWRGTPYGLTRMIEVCTGLTPRITEDPNTPYVFRIAVRIPSDSKVRSEMIERLVRTHKPAHVGYVLEVTT
jgi:phage tail-like protein